MTTRFAPVLASLAATIAIVGAMLGIRHATGLDAPPAGYQPPTQPPATAPYNPTSTLDPRQVTERKPADPIAQAKAAGVPACQTDEIPTDGSACYWDAHTQGNGRGLSYIANHGRITWSARQ
jgi:hypothetical protein